MTDPGPRKPRPRPRYQPQTDAAQRCRGCDQLWSPKPGDRAMLCLSCRVTPPLIPLRKAKP